MYIASIIHTLLQEEQQQDKDESSYTPYAFYVSKNKARRGTIENQEDEEGTIHWDEPMEITSSLLQYLSQQLQENHPIHGSSITEQVLTIVYQPLAIFRVRPGTCICERKKGKNIYIKRCTIRQKEMIT